MSGVAGVLAGAVGFAGCGSGSLNLRRVDWRDVTLPASVCGMTNGPIHLHNGTAYGPTHRWGQSLVAVSAGWNPVVYGNLGSHGGQAAAIAAECSNGGGTADGVFAYVQVVFTGVGNSLRVAGVVTPQEQPHHEMPTLLAVSIRPGEVIAHEAFYGKMDGTCCPSGRATTVWTYAQGRLAPGKPVVTREPRS